MDADFAATDRLANLIAERLRTLDELVKLARRQRELALEGSTIGVVEALAAKQPFVDRLIAIERALDPFRDQEPDQRVWRNEELRLRTRRMGELCEPLLAETLAIETECERLLTERKEAVAVRLDGAQRTARARTGYAGGSSRRTTLDLTTEG